MAQFLADMFANVGSSFANTFTNSIFGGINARNDARNYNRYQDKTYPADTARMLDRMDTLYPGTSPWERLGVNAGSPMPSPSYEDNSKSDFIAATMPLKIAEQNNKTALTMKEMENATNKEIAAMYTNNGEKPKAETGLTNDQARKVVAEVANVESLTNLNRLLAITESKRPAYLDQQTRSEAERTKNIATDTDLKKSQIPEAQSRILLNAASTIDKMNQVEFRNFQQQIIKDDQLLRTMGTLLSAMPKTTRQEYGQTTTETAYGKDIAKLLSTNYTDDFARAQDVADLFQKMDKPKDAVDFLHALAQSSKGVSDIIGGVTGATSGLADIFKK